MRTRRISASSSSASVTSSTVSIAETRLRYSARSAAKRIRLSPGSAVKGFCEVAHNFAGAGIANVNEGAPGIESRIGSPASDIELVPAQVSAARIGDHQRRAPIAEKMRARDGGLFRPDAIRGFVRTEARAPDRVDSDFFEGQLRNRNSFEKQRLDAPGYAGRCESAAAGRPDVRHY